MNGYVYVRFAINMVTCEIEKKTEKRELNVYVFRKIVKLNYLIIKLVLNVQFEIFKINKLNKVTLNEINCYLYHLKNLKVNPLNGRLLN